MEDFQKKANKILKIAEEKGLSNNYLFSTTWHRYLVQISMLDELEKTIDAVRDSGLMITKEYVKNRENVYTHPAIAEYNRTSDAANKTVTTLVKIINSFSDEGREKVEVDPLMAVLNRIRGEDE